MPAQGSANASIAESRRWQVLQVEELCVFPFLCHAWYPFPNVRGDGDGGCVDVRGKYSRIAIQAEKGTRWMGTKIRGMGESLSPPTFDFEIDGIDRSELMPE